MLETMGASQISVVTTSADIHFPPLASTSQHLISSSASPRTSRLLLGPMHGIAVTKTFFVAVKAYALEGNYIKNELK